MQCPEICPASSSRRDDYCFLITGTDGSAIGGFLKALEDMLQNRDPEDRICAFGKGGDMADAKSRLEEIVQELNARKKAQSRAMREAGG